MTVASVTDLLGLLRDKNLIPAPQLQLIAGDLPTEYPDARAAAEMLVRRKWLTPYQVEQIFKAGGQNLLLGPYVLLEPLGEGGMGQVYKARHTLLDRVVALKLIREERLNADPEAVRRFQREARAAAALSHPNIITIYDLGQAGDAHFIAMEYIEGTDLSQWVRTNGPLSVAQACEFTRQAALGLQHAHEQGMVHRDIKPGNLFAAGLLLHPAATPNRGLSRIGARPAIPGGRTLEQVRGLRPASKAPAPEAKLVIKILDMGLVRVANVDDARSASASLTQEGSIVGTPDYIAPEQARNARSVDIRADLYSLGGTLYYLLTGFPPFAEGSAIEKLLMHQLDEPVPVAARRPDVPANVAAVVHKLLAKAPRDRYQTPGELAEVLAGLAVPDRPAPPPPPPPRAPLLERSVPPPAVPRSEMKTPPMSSRADALGPPTVSNRPAASKATPAPGVSLQTANPHTPPLTPPPRVGPPTSPPDGLVAASVYKWAATTPDPSETFQDRQPAKLIAVLKGHSGCVVSLAFSGDRDTLASGGVDGAIRLWDFTGNKPREKAMLAKHADAVQALAFAPDNRLLASGSGGMDGTVWLWNLAGEQPRPFIALQGHKSPVDALAFAGDGKLLASGGNDTTVRIWELGQQPRARATLKGHIRPVKALAFAPDGQTLASAAQDYTVRLWALSRMWSKERASLPHEGEVNSVGFAPDGRTLAVACQDQTVRLWDLGGAQPAERAMLTGHKGTVRLVQFTADGAYVVAVGEARQVIVWDLATGNKVQEWALPRLLSTSFALTVDSRYLASGSSEGPVNVYRVAEKRSQPS